MRLGREGKEGIKEGGLVRGEEKGVCMYLDRLRIERSEAV